MPAKVTVWRRQSAAAALQVVRRYSAKRLCGIPQGVPVARQAGRVRVYPAHRLLGFAGQTVVTIALRKQVFDVQAYCACDFLQSAISKTFHLKTLPAVFHYLQGFGAVF